MGRSVKGGENTACVDETNIYQFSLVVDSFCPCIGHDALVNVCSFGSFL